MDDTLGPQSKLLSVLGRFAEADVPSSIALRQQLHAITITDQTISPDSSRGALDLRVGPEAPDLPSLSGFPIHGWYVDADGEAVLLILVAASDHRLSVLEFWKANPELRVIKWPPDDPTLVHVQVISKAPINDFDIVSGWTPRNGGCP